jgi:3-oxoacyl-[acyl-carrier protein] reductase
MPNPIAKQDGCVLITGARKGIGRYLVDHYLSKGYSVVGCSRQPSDLDSPRYDHFALDVSDEGAVRKMFSEIRKKHRSIQLLVNNAAVNPAISPALLQPVSTAIDTFHTNFIGTFLFCREATKLMMKSSFGRIVNMSSMAVRHEVPGESLYTSSKAAVTAFSRVFAKEVHQYGITCNVIAPAAVPTDLMNAVNPAALNEVLARNAIHSMGEFSDISNAIDWLMLPQSNAITGQVIYLGGA